MGLTAEMEAQLRDQRNEQQKCQRSVQGWLQSADRQLSALFSRLDKERLRSQAALARAVEERS